MKFLRILWLCLLIFAIPLQSMASATQMFCHGSNLSVLTDQSTLAHSYQEAPGNDHDHDHDQAQAQPSEHQGSKVTDVKSLNHKCSACAQCCFGAAVLPAPLKLIFGQETSVFVATSTVLLGEFSPNNLERPPRSFLY